MAKSPEKSQLTASEEYSDELVDEITIKLQKQMDEKKRRDRKTDFAEDFDHRILDRRETLDPEPTSEPEKIESPLHKPDEAVQPTKVNSKDGKILTSLKGSLLGRISKSNGPAQSTPR